MFFIYLCLDGKAKAFDTTESTHTLNVLGLESKVRHSLKLFKFFEIISNVHLLFSEENSSTTLLVESTMQPVEEHAI